VESKLFAPFLTAEWRNLLMLNYEVPPSVLEPFVPAGTELDRHQGRAYASIVAFQFLNTRLLGVPIPLHRNFEELNLRFYVRREASSGPRRGVVFIREVVPRRAIAAVARAVYNEPYVALPMRSHVHGTPQAVTYGWREGGCWQELSAAARGEGALPARGSHEEFITDHLWGYTRQRDGSTIEYRVEHPPWQVWLAPDCQVRADFGSLYGPVLGAVLRDPATTFIAGGSRVAVYRPERLAPGKAAA
jgi:uncharacterized protein YqjF (DUF2071 family)